MFFFRFYFLEGIRKLVGIKAKFETKAHLTEPGL